jgi:hypothetical protein
VLEHVKIIALFVVAVVWRCLVETLHTVSMSYFDAINYVFLLSFSLSRALARIHKFSLALTILR